MAFVLLDAFEALVLPRSANSNLRMTFFFVHTTWRFWRSVAFRLRGARREQHLWVYGPLSIIMLLGLWVACLVLSFALLQWAGGSRINDPIYGSGFGSDLYMSGETFFTLGYGDVVPRAQYARSLSVLEAGMGLGLLAIVIGYLPVLYQAFSRREVGISRLDARAGSPPTALELIRRQSRSDAADGLAKVLSEWEHWSAELLESHLSYPVLVFYRSQHDRQSWLASLAAILDTCAIVIASVASPAKRQAKLTFAMARHAIIDLTLILNRPPIRPAPVRMRDTELDELLRGLAECGIVLDRDVGIAEFGRIRDMYEPYLFALGDYLVVDVPGWLPDPALLDNWETSAWERDAHFHS
jgi:hypothetical protein